MKLDLTQKWDDQTVDQTMKQQIAKEFLSVGTAICRAGFDAVPGEVAEVPDLTLQSMLYHNFAKKVIPRQLYLAELISSIAERDVVMQIGKCCFAKLRTDSGGNKAPITEEDLID